MSEVVNFENNGRFFNIHLGLNGDLSFLANDLDGGGNFRMAIIDESGVVTIGGGGSSGALQMRGPGNENTIFLGVSGTDASVVLGGSGLTGRIRLFDSSGRETVDLNREPGRFDLGGVGNDGNLFLQDDTGTTNVHLDGGVGRLRLDTPGGGLRAELAADDAGRLQLFNSSGVTVDLRGDAGQLELGGNGEDGRLEIKNAAGDITINCDGSTGNIEADGMVQRSDGRLKTNVTPLSNALDSVLALRGVRYQRKQVTAPAAAATGDGQRIGFVGQEVESVCPELVATDAEGYKAVDYSRMTAVLVEAVKEQQQLIREQAAALELISERLGLPAVTGQSAAS